MTGNLQAGGTEVPNQRVGFYSFTIALFVPRLCPVNDGFPLSEMVM
jgi:hypothetical protein